jgi:hypothetical protein
MRRSICFTEPTTGIAGERNTWRFIVTPSVNLPKGTLLKFDLGGKGRVIDWEVPAISSKNNANIIWAEIEGGKTLQPKAVKVPNSIVPQFEFTLPAEVPAGKKITVCMGTTNAGKEEKLGNLSQLNIQRRRPFYLYIDPSGKHQYSDPEIFTIDIKGNALHTIRILAPSVAVKNKRFDVILRFEDRFGNLTNNAPEDTLIEFTHENLRDSLKWRLFLPETGFIALPNLYFNEPGIYAIHLKNLKTGEEFQSGPIKCFANETKNIFWGTLHGESERFDSGENIENCLRHFRDEKSLNFFGCSVPESIEETSNETWKKICEQVAEFDEDDRFCALLGQQFCGELKEEGLRVLIYNKDDRPILRRKDARSSSLKKIYKLFSSKEVLSIPSFTMSSSTSFDFADFHSEHERVAEIYNAWGCSERTAKEGNSFPISSSSKKGLHESTEGSLLKALMKNRRFGFVSGGLDDRSVFSSLYDTDQKQYPSGLTGVLCERLTRQNIFEALYNRQCYATTGERIVLGLSLAGSPIGSELSTLQKPGLHINRHLSGFVAGTAPLKKVELIRNGEVIKTFSSATNSIEFAFDDMGELAKCSIKAPETSVLFAFYYLRVIQANGHMAWSSPIWIDCMPRQAKKPAAKPPAKIKDPKVLKKQLEAFDDEEDGEDFEDDEDDEDDDF